jgi:hypothetical protein
MKLLAASFAAALLASPAAADLHVWKDKDQQGEHRRIRRAVRDFRNLRLDDAISSLKADERWLVCSEPLFRGDCRLVEGNVSNLTELGFNNRITSARPAPPELEIPPPEAEPEPEPAAPAPSTAEEATLPDATSWRKTAPPSPAPAPSREPEPAPGTEWWSGEQAAPVFEAPRERRRRAPRIEAFAEPNYAGKRLRLNDAIVNVGELDQPVQSLLVRSGTWQVCSRPGFQGDCTTLLVGSVGSDLGTIGSLRPVTPDR